MVVHMTLSTNRVLPSSEMTFPAAGQAGGSAKPGASRGESWDTDVVLPPGVSLDAAEA